MADPRIPLHPNTYVVEALSVLKPVTLPAKIKQARQAILNIRYCLIRYKFVARAFAIGNALLEAGMEPVLLRDAVATMLAESNGSKIAKGYNKVGTPDETIDYGPYQINAVHGNNPAAVSTYYGGAVAAVKLMFAYKAKGKHPLDPWVAFRSGQYKYWLGIADEAIAWMEL